jgi:type I restriction enzyme M protein
MLDDVTKKRINTLRQILVGKLPDPKAQVEQITNGLIYKFMNDMDEQSVSMGGKSTYFSGKFQKYSWKNLLDTKTSGVEKIKLYSDAIEQMYTNENLPELFREIFKNSFLPFKDPSTLNMFLKEIDEFHYSNSEKLGDAFEYLLSFMGSQGDAGQFRTPRHIIDFITEIVNPQKNETVLDPACGTAGFLISSYKHILNQNTKKNLGDELTASDRKKIGENLNGYDISPDMVKMSLVNMYLHKFTNPKISEYDTLSSEDRWNEYYDVVLANPPFFSPKGGITPHNRFGVKSTKAEVLFIDYINEHLKPNGRAGIIVPEGIIFQSGTAYKQLRKRLLETSLIGVISLPAGVFQPYSGVKTSILILDKEKNKVRNNIFFIDLKNDGFSLSANRNPIQENEIPIYLEKIKNDLKDLKCVEKKEILKNPDFSFTFKSYLDEINKNSNFSYVNLTDVCELYQPKTITQKELIDNGKYPVYGANGVIGRYNNFNHENPEIAITCRGATCGTINLTEPFSWITGNAMVCKISDSHKINKKYLFYFLKNSDFSSVITGSAQPQITRQNFNNFKIPLPSIEKQNQIAEELDGYQKIIEGCGQIIENHKPSIDIDQNWEMVELNQVANFKRGPFGGSLKKEIFKMKGYLVYEQYHAINDDYSKERYFIDENKFEEMKGFAVKENDLIISCSGTMGKISIIPKNFKKGIINQALLKLTPDEKLVNPYFLKYYLQSPPIQNRFFTDQSGSVIQNVSSVQVLKKIPFPKIDIYLQNEIVKKIDEELNIIKLNKNLVKTYNSKIQETINKVWSN